MNLLHGDCLKLLHGIDAGSVDLILTDPPYGMTDCKWDSIIPLEPMWVELKRIIKPNGAIVLMAAQPFTTVLIASNMSMFKYCWYWIKNKKTGFLNVQYQPLKCVEDVCVFYANIPSYTAVGTRKVNKIVKKATSTIYSKLKGGISYQTKTGYPCQALHFSHDAKTVHPTQKPVALMSYLIRTYTTPGDTVLDFTMGSGTTGVACHDTGREFIGIEMDDTYFKNASDRIKAAEDQPFLFKETDA